MALLDHFGYLTHPVENYNDPLWYNRDDFKPWLEHIKDSKRLIIIDDSAASPKSSKPDVIHKKLQVTSDKIKAKSGREVRARSYKTEPDSMEGEPSIPKKRDGRAEKKPKRGGQKDQSCLQLSQGQSSSRGNSQTYYWREKSSYIFDQGSQA